MKYNLIKNITLGCDPELFLEREGEIISAVGLIGGSKYEPKPISKKGHAIQEDNVLVEFCIPPSKTKRQFIKNINFVKEYLDVTVSAFDAKLNYSASATLSDKELNSKQAKLFGCDPDFNVYLKAMNTPPNANTNMRSAGGHIHVGFENPKDEIVEKLVMALDMTVGLKSLFLDKDDKRKELYGKAGCFRFKEYGMEYRTPSNFWIATDELISWAWDTTFEAIELVNSGKIDELVEKYSTKVVEAINNNDKELANSLLEQIFGKKLVTV